MADCGAERKARHAQLLVVDEDALGIIVAVKLRREFAQVEGNVVRRRLARSQQESSSDVYFIQAGSFQNPAEADNQKARLAILGYDSSVEPANLPDKGTWYRVRMGPYQKLDEINRIRQSLAQNGIEASLVKIKDQP